MPRQAEAASPRLFATIPPALSPGDPAEIAVNLHKMKFVQLSRSYARSGHVIITTMMMMMMMMPPLLMKEMLKCGCKVARTAFSLATHTHTRTLAETRNRISRSSFGICLCNTPHSCRILQQQHRQFICICGMLHYGLPAAEAAAASAWRNRLERLISVQSYAPQSMQLDCVTAQGQPPRGKQLDPAR